jgi:hypothetical protein
VKLTDPWFEAEFYGNCFEDAPCEDPECLGMAKPHVHSGHSRHGPEIDGAQGLILYCPCAYGTDKAHGLQIPFSNPRNAPTCPPNHEPWSRSMKTHPRWTMSGTGLDDLTLTPSVAVGEPECWHGYIENGVVR